MDHPLNGNLRAPEDRLRGLSTEIVDDIVVKIARALHSSVTFRYLRLNKLVIHIRSHKYGRDINNTIILYIWNNIYKYFDKKKK